MFSREQEQYINDKVLQLIECRRQSWISVNRWKPLVYGVLISIFIQIVYREFGVY